MSSQFRKQGSEYRTLAFRFAEETVTMTIVLPIYLVCLLVFVLDSSY